MSYVSLARKYRPRRFLDMVGQEATTLALTNAIKLNREPHSVIFTGVRGVGKTTTARIYAKALNCEAGPTAEPCDNCSSCHAITLGNHEDVLEIDGASNTGVDDIRALQETLSYVPQRSTFKIYIIDEVHMLSISAFNALLKTLEEPPQHVVFIFATTELHKLPETIQSRCQTFHLQKISRPVISERIRSILQAEQISFEESALSVIAREGRGSLRDALTFLDQAIAIGAGFVGLDTVKHMVGSSQSIPALEMLDGLLRKDAKQILDVIAGWDQEGLAMNGLAEAVATACRNAFVLRDLKGQAIDLKILELEEKEQQILLELGVQAGSMDLNRLFRQMARCLDDLRQTDLDRYIFENYCLEWCFDPGLPDIQSFARQISTDSGSAGQQVVARNQQQQQDDVPTMNLRERLKAQSNPNKPIPTSKKELEGVDNQSIPSANSVKIDMVTSSYEGSSKPVQQPSVEPVRTKRQALDTPPMSTKALIAETPIIDADLPKDLVESYPNHSIFKETPAEIVETPKSSVSVTTEADFPRDWRSFVDTWKRQKPLLARYLEEAYLLEYSPQRICLAVDPGSMAGGKLLQVEIRRKFVEQFAKLFLFQGQLEVVARTDTMVKNQESASNQDDAMETLLDVKQREKVRAQEDLRQKLEDHPMTRELISRFGGTIDQIELLQ